MRIYILLVTLFLCAFSTQLAAQSDTTEKKGLLYNVSGIGFAFPLGKTREALKPKFSTNLGFVFKLGQGGMLLYAAADFLSFNYKQRYLSSQNNHQIENGNSSFYVVNIAPGYRKQLNKLGIYGYIGPGMGLISEPRISVKGDVASVNDRYHFTATARTGVGLDYAIGDFMVFVEAGYLHNFHKIEREGVDILPVFVGLKSDMSGLLKIFR